AAGEPMAVGAIDYQHRLEGLRVANAWRALHEEYALMGLATDQGVAEPSTDRHCVQRAYLAELATLFDDVRVGWLTRDVVDDHPVERHHIAPLLRPHRAL